MAKLSFGNQGVKNKFGLSDLNLDFGFIGTFKAITVSHLISQIKTIQLAILLPMLIKFFTDIFENQNDY